MVYPEVRFHAHRIDNKCGGCSKAEDRDNMAEIGGRGCQVRVAKECPLLVYFMAVRALMVTVFVAKQQRVPDLTFLVWGMIDSLGLWEMPALSVSSLRAEYRQPRAQR